MTRFTLAVSAAISLFAASGIGVAHAGEVISDQRYWPNEEVQSQRYWPNDPYGYYRGYYGSRPAYDAMASMYGVAPNTDTGSSFIYRGGPKTGTRDYNYTREW